MHNTEAVIIIHFLYKKIKHMLFNTYLNNLSAKSTKMILRQFRKNIMHFSFYLLWMFVGRGVGKIGARQKKKKRSLTEKQEGDRKPIRDERLLPQSD